MEQKYQMDESLESILQVLLKKMQNTVWKQIWR